MKYANQRGRLRHGWFAMSCIFFMLLAGCGGAGENASTANGNASVMRARNVQPVTVERGPANSINAIFTSVTLCVAGGGDRACQTIDHILVDTGSTGLRIMAEALAVPLAPQAGPDQKVLAECAQFADGYTWGPIRLADVRMADERANAVPIQVIGESDFAAAPDSCSATGPALNTAAAFGANGVLGISVLRQDCGDACAQDAYFGAYFACAGAVCDPATVSLERQIQNPVAMFAMDNNGSLIALPSIPAAGLAQAHGALIFGIGTQPNNALGHAEIIGVDHNTGDFSTIYNGQAYDGSFVDSGSNAIFFPGADFTICGNFYCPDQSQSVTAINRGTNGIDSVVSFTVANAVPLVNANPGLTALDSLAGPNYKTRGFDWGLPFFFGRKVFTAIEGRATPAGTGPYIAY